MSSGPGAGVLRRHDGHPFAQLGVLVWEDLHQLGMLVFDAEAPHEGRGRGVSLLLSESGVMLGWILADESQIDQDTPGGRRGRTSVTILTGALSSVLLALGYRVRVEYMDGAIPAPYLYVDGFTARPN
jgi:hypothetical protein